MNKKPISHFNRRHIKMKSEKTSSISCYIIQVEHCVDELTGRVIHRSFKKPYNPSTSLSKFRVSDFTITNLAAAGIDINCLNVCKLTSTPITAVDNLERQFAKIDSSINSVNP